MRRRPFFGEIAELPLAGAAELPPRNFGEI